jgi:hypothetical protein
VNSQRKKANGGRSPGERRATKNLSADGAFVWRDLRSGESIPPRWTPKRAFTKTDDRIAYHMEEFKALKGEIAELVKSTASYLQYAILASAAVYAWLATAKISKPEEGVYTFFSPHVLEFAAFLPSVLSVVFGMLTLASYKRISEKGDYLAALEQQFRLSTTLGWQNKLKDASRLIRWSYVLGWSTLIICNLVGGALLVWGSAEPNSFYVTSTPKHLPAAKTK